jgi:FtsX-like permease family protein
MTTNSTLTRPGATRPVARWRAGWPRDLVLGLRLAVGGGRTSLVRLVLGTIGIGLATAVLLVSASVGHIVATEHAREQAAEPATAHTAGVAPLDYYPSETEYQGTYLNGTYLHATGPNSPAPPGVDRVPGPNEIVLSPAMAQLLGSPAGALLRPRFPQRVIGLIGAAGLIGPQQLTFYAGLSADRLPAGGLGDRVYSFGATGSASSSFDPVLQAFVLIGVVALLVPILIMVSISSRIAGAERDRRLAALRLVGAGARQVRRIAAAESLAGAGAGLLLGAVLFLVFRQVAPRVAVLGVSAFTSDVTPSWPLIVLIVLLVPVLAVASALFALRRTVIEPLGVVRGGRPVRRRLWWRAALVVVGVGLLLLAQRVSSAGPLWTELVVIGGSALLVGVPVLLPWLLERTVGMVRGGPASWQLAIRRLQLDSGTPARVVGGVAVVLAGAIALQTVAVAASARFDIGAIPRSTPGQYTLRIDGSVAAQADEALRRSSAIHGVYTTSLLMMTPSLTDWRNESTQIQIASCDSIQALTGASDCTDGDAFTLNGNRPITTGTQLTAIAVAADGNGPPTEYGRWTVPAHLRSITEISDLLGGSLLITPGAIAGVRLPLPTNVETIVRTDPNQPDVLEYVRNAVAAYPLQAFVETFGDPAALSVDQQTFLTIRNGLLVGSLFTLLLAGVSLLVLALEQVRERRRPLAMLSAAGVPRSVLARSLLWQVAVPVGVGVVAATATGIGLAALVLRMTSTRMVLDWSDIGVFCAAAVLLVLLVTAATLPALRNATRLSALRTE